MAATDRPHRRKQVRTRDLRSMGCPILVRGQGEATSSQLPAERFGATDGRARLRRQNGAVPQDTPSSITVSARMSRQSPHATAAETAVRRLLHAAGLRYRVNYPVPHMPRRRIDIAFTKTKIAVIVDGCFWHGCPEHATQPKENVEWWQAKLAKNMARDVETTHHLTAEGWTVLRFWEHDPPEYVAERVAAGVAERRDG